MKNGGLFLKVILISIIIQFSNSQSLSNSEKSCLTNLTNKISNYRDSNTWCTSFTCDLSPDSSYLYIKKLKLENTNGATASLFYSDFSCFLNLSSLDLTYYTLSYSSFFGESTQKGLAISIMLNKTFNLDFPKYVNFPTTSLSFVLANTPFTVSKFNASSIGNLKTLIFSTELSAIPSSMNLPILNNDLTSNTIIHLENFQFLTRDVPNLNNFNITTLGLVLQQNITGTDNFPTFTTIQNFYLLINETQTINFPDIFKMSNKIENADLTGKFNIPTSIIDITPSSNLKTLRFTQLTSGIYNNFAYPQPRGFPLILPQSIQYIDMPKSGIDLPQLDTLPNLAYINFQGNSINGYLPSKISPSIKLMDLSGNSITGTIPSLYCNTMINVGNNQISGSLPECFQCYYATQQILFVYFIGNPNLNVAGPCTLKAIPNFILDPATKIFKLWGSNLGYSYPASSANVSFTSILAINSEFVGTYNDSMTASIIKFAFMGSNYTLALTPTAPNIINISGNGVSSYTFNGQYFSYNKSDISITVGGSACQITSAAFSSVVCTGATFQNGSELVVIFRVGDLSTQVSLISGASFNAVAMCSHSCNHGFCSTVGSVGKCVCDPTYVGSDCSISNPCASTCLNGGNCDYLYGSCNCTSNWVGSDCSTPYIPCVDVCLNGLCNNQTGKCVCIIGWSGKTCEEVSLDCPKNCSFSTGGGVCNRTIGECICNSNYQSSDCSLPYVQCNNDCNRISNVGNKCNNQTGACTCSTNWQGTSCEFPSQYISSIQPTTTEGGFVLIYGWFGGSGDHSNLIVMIGTLECSVNLINESLINCTIGSGSGTKSVSIQQNGYTYTGKDIFHYTDITYKCPNDCSGHGTCNNLVGQCKCYIGWGGFDCNAKNTIQSPSTSTTSTSTSSSTTTTTGTSTPEPTKDPIVIPETTTKVNTTIGSAIINNEETSYEIRIISLVEMDYNGVAVKTMNLTEKWDVEKLTQNNTFVFMQKLNGTNCTVTYSIEEVEKTRDYNFAGLDLTLDAGGIKITVKIENYQYLNSLNTLQLQFESLVGSTNKNSDVNDDCNKENLSVDTNEMNKDQLLNYITISKDQKILYGRFINRVISDTRPTFITTSIVSNKENSVILGLNLPHCIDSCLIDPDFSVLVSSSYKTCGDSDESGRPAWFLPVVIVVPCVAVASIIIIGAVIYRKNRMAILLAKDKYSFSLRKLSRNK